MSSEETFNTIVIGGGQAGLAAGYYLTQRGEYVKDTSASTADSAV